MKVNKSKIVTRLFITSLIALCSLTGCLEDPKGKPAHAIGAILGANMDNILLDFPTATLGGDGPYCLYFLPNKKIDSVDIDSVVQSFPYSVTLKETKTIGSKSSFDTSCGMGILERNGHRSKVALKSYKLLQGTQLSAIGVPITSWQIKRFQLGGGMGATAYITQYEYTPSTAVLQINNKLITETLVVIGIQ